MALDESIVGRTSAPQDFDVEPGAIRRFAAAIGDTNPLFLDEEHARSLGYASVIAPPTFPTTFRAPLPVDLELSHVLHGQQEFTYVRPIVAGEVIRCVTTITNRYEREGSLGKMTFLVVTIQGDDRSGQPVFTGKSTIIVH